MARLPRPPIKRTRRGFRINLDVEERDLIHRLLGELRSLLIEAGRTESDGPEPDGRQRGQSGPSGDDRLRRLFPSAYHQAGDREFDDEFRRLMHDELISSRLAGLDLIADSLAPTELDPPELTEAQMFAFLQALNGVRLVLGTILDVSQDDDVARFGDNHPLVGEHHLYDFLSWVLDSSVRALQS